MNEMSDFKPRPGTFLPYMEYSRRNEGATAIGAGSPLTLLEILGRQAQRSLPIFDLQTLAGMAPRRYADALRSLKDAGFIEISGEALQEVVKLTESGARVVQLAKPS